MVSPVSVAPNQIILTTTVLTTAVITSIASFLVIMITCLACYAPNYEPSQNVWETFINDSGWGSGGVAFLTGLVAPNYMYAGIDGALHLAEECQNAATVVPRALMSTVFIGFVTSLALMVAMLYCTSDLSAAVSTSTGYVQFSPKNVCSRTSLIPLIVSPSMKCGIKQPGPPSHRRFSSSSSFSQPPLPSSGPTKRDHV